MAASLLLFPQLLNANTESYVAPAAAVPPPRDVAWPGTLTLAVDATDLDHRLLRVTQTLPVSASGRLTLLYPRWLPGTHGPYGDATALSGLQVSAHGQSLSWQRDTLDPHAFHVDVPPGATVLQLSFEYVAPLTSAQGRTSITRQLLGVQWNQVLLYPAGHFARAIRIAARVRLPVGWQQASALRGDQGPVPQADAEGWVRYAAVSLETLVDSPLFASPHARRIELDPPGSDRPVALHLLTDSADEIKPSEAQIQAHRALVTQADLLFGVRPWRRYDFLLAISDTFGGIGLEHHESSENAVRSGYFKDWDKAIRARQLLPHEYVHAWNGKFRRPADLWTPQFNVPMRNSLLWVYEGLTQYWGHVLSARAGLTTVDQANDRLAGVAAWADARSGRRWRNLQDTTNEGTLASRRGKPWPDWQRGVDYYDESTLIWLDADTLIRQRSGGRKSLDDFARSFFGVATPTHADGSIKPLTYRLEDLLQALDAVLPHDWAGFFRQRLDGHGPGAPLEGLARGGWRLTWSDSESSFARNAEGWGGDSGRERASDFVYSLGLSLARNGRIENVARDSPAFAAGLAPGMTLVAVNMEAYKEDRLTAAVKANQGGQAPIDLLLRDGDYYRAARLDWRGGLRHPRLERIPDSEDLLGAILAPR